MNSAQFLLLSTRKVAVTLFLKLPYIKFFHFLSCKFLLPLSIERLKTACLELAVDGLKLAAVNTPTMLSTPLSIVAGIVVGEYAVSSGWFNPESLLYMAVVTVGTYGQTNFEMGYAFKFLRVLTLILTQIFNLGGFIAGVVISVLMIA